MSPKRRRKKGTGQIVRPTGRSRTWGIRYTEGDAIKYQGGYQTKGDAQAALDTITWSISRGLPGIPIAPKVSPLVSDVSQDFLAERGANSVDDANRWARDVEPHLGTKRLDEVDTALIARMVTSLGTRISGASVERALFLAAAFFRWAKRHKHTAAPSPVAAYLATLAPRERKAIKSQHDPKDTPFLDSKDDIARLYAVLPSPVNLAYALSALAGLRPGEAIALEWADVDLASAQINVRQQVRHGKVGATKSGKSRPVPIVPGLLTVLKAAKGTATKPLVVPARGSKHLGHKTVGAAMDAACKSLGFVDSDGEPLTFYQAGRHTFASQWVKAGLDFYRLSKIMGHASIVTTQRYAHLRDTTPADVLAAADVALG